MPNFKCIKFAILWCIATFGLGSQTLVGMELTSNGDFEFGATIDWESFAIGTQTFLVTNDAASGSFAGELVNDMEAQPLVVKQANLGVGVVNPGDTLQVSFSAKGSGEAGGVAFAEFFSELDAGGVSKSEILGGNAPLQLTDTYQTFNFSVTAGSDVSGGVTLQFNAATGANAGSTSTLFIDDVSVSLPGGSLACDLDGDGDCDVLDIDMLYTSSPTTAEISTWLDQASDPANPYKTASGGTTADIYILGDVDLNGDVDSIDLGLLLNNFNTTEVTAGWGSGNLDAAVSDQNFRVSSIDLGLLLNNFGSVSSSAVAVPEPSACLALLIALITCAGSIRRSRVRA